MFSIANFGNVNIATVSRSEAQEAAGGPLGPGNRPPGGPANRPWTTTRSFGDVTTSTDETIPGFHTIPALPTRELTSVEIVPPFKIIPTRPTDLSSPPATPANDIISPNGGVTDQTSTSVGNSISIPSNMAPTTSTGGVHTASQRNSDASSNRTLVITLSTILSVVAFLILFGSIFLCYRFKRGRLPVFKRGISPIDDEEIESWKANRDDEKYTSLNRDERHNSTGSVKKPPSVIVYQNPAVARASGEHSPHFSCGHSYQRSIDIPQTPVLARAPNSRPGLTDETVEGDDAYIPSPRRHPSRLSKLPSPRHARTRSSRSSISVGSYHAWLGSPNSPRASNEYSHYYPRTSHSYDRKHTRIYSNSSNPPRLSFEDDFFMGGLSPRPLIRRSDFTPESEIGRAIG
jgi:hypothetical protein